MTVVTQNGFSITLDATDNRLPANSVFAAVTSSGALGNLTNLTLVNGTAGGGLELGSGAVIDLNLTSAGSGYTGSPVPLTATISAPAGVGGARATGQVVAGVKTVGVTSAGAGYLSAPTVTISGTGGAAAVAIVDSNPLSSTYGQVTSIQIIDPGTGYLTLPTVTLSGGSPTQAAVVAATELQITGLVITNPGSRYDATPTVTISGTGGSGAAGTTSVGGTGGVYFASGSSVSGGITGNLNIRNLSAALGISQQTTGTAGAIAVAGTTTLADSSAAGISMGNNNNNLQGTITLTQSGGGNVAIGNKNSSVLGNFTLTGAGNLAVTSTGGSIYQFNNANVITVPGAASFFATANGLVTGTPVGAVILNNALNNFGGSVSAAGTRVIIRDNTALILGAVTASTSLSATSTSAGITQSGVITSTGAASFAAANGFSIDVGTQANTFSSTVSFAALSGTLANVSVRDTTALDLGAITLTGNLGVTAPGITQSGALVVPGTITLVGGSANNITLNNPVNNFGTVVITSGNNVAITDLNSIILGAGTVSGAFNLNSGISSQSGPITVVGTTTVTAGLNVIDLSNSGNDFGTSVNLSNRGPNNISVQDVGALVIGNISMSSVLGGGLTIQAGGDITQLTGTTITTGTGLIAITGVNDSSITLANAGNAFNGTVTLAPSVGAGNRLLNVSLSDTTAFDLQALTLSGNLSITSGGAVTDSGDLEIVGTTTISAVGQNITLDRANQFTGAVSLTGADVAVRDISGLILGTTTATGTLAATATTGNITQSGAISVTGASTFTAATGADITLGNSANTFTGAVTFASAGTLSDITLADTTAYQIQDGLNISGNLALTAAGITQGVGAVNAITIGGTATLNGGTGAIVLTNSGNSYGGTVTVTGGASADMFFSLADEGDLGPVTTSGAFTLRTAAGISFNIANGASAGFDVTSAELSNFNVGTFAPIASGGGDLNLGALTAYPGIGGISLTTVGGGVGLGGDINALGVINLNTLQLNSSGGATFSAVNQIQNLGNVTVAVGGVTLQNSRGLNLTGTATMPGRLNLEVAGQFYNQTGQSQPLAGVAGGSVIKSLSLMGGLPNLISGMAGFSYRYDGQMPTSGNVMSYAVSPLTMFAPSGTTIAGVNLSGTQTGGGQFNTFLTGSDNLNWMISDFGRFDMPTVKPSGMDYILYPQRVEPETRTLPAATLGQLERELGRPPTLDEIQAREVAVREAAMVRSGAILERTSFDAVEDETDKQDSAEVPVQVIDGAKPQAGGPSVAPNPLSGGAMEGFGSQARKTRSVRQGSNGPILRSGPIRSVAQLRPAEPSQSGNISEASAQALKLDAKSVIEQERASAEVGIAPPIAAGK